MMYSIFSSQSFEQLFLKILSVVIGGLILRFLLFKNKRRWLYDHPMVKYRIDMIFYIYHKYIYSYFFITGFVLYFIVFSLFAPEYNTLPRFIAAWISYAVGLSTTVILQYYMNRDLKRPVRPY